MAEWELKGQGAANIVYGYVGNDTELMGHVMRLRKSAAHVGSTIDQLIWSGVLDWFPDDAMRRELTYIRTMMAPKLGEQYVFPGEPCPAPKSLRSFLGSRFSSGKVGGGPAAEVAVAAEGSSMTDTVQAASEAAAEALAAADRTATAAAEAAAGGQDGGDFPALLIPDHTTIQPGACPGYVGVGPVICLEVKPKWGLFPGEGITPTDDGTGAAAGGGELATAAATATVAVGPAGTSAATATATVSVAAAAAADTARADGCHVSARHVARREGQDGGATGAEAAGVVLEGAASIEAAGPEGAGVLTHGSGARGRLTAQEVSRSYPRFMLHMLQKHVERGSRLCYYNPLDLFSGEGPRMRTALRRLVEVPSNNLRVFRNGDLVYGSGSDKGGKKKDKGEKGGNNGEGEEEAEEGAHEHGHAPGGTRGKHDAHGRGKGEKGGHGTGEEEGGSGAAGLHKFAAAARGLVRVLPAGDGGSGGAAEQEGGQQQGDGETGHRVGGEERGGGGGGRGRGREEEEPEAVVEAVVRLAAAALQREGVLSRLQAVQRLDPLGAAGALRVYEQLLADVQAGVLQLPGQGLASASSDDNGTAAAAAAAAAPAAAAAAAAVPSSWSSRLAALRAYLMSATAKDCGIMVTLQRAQPTTDTNGNRNGDNADGGAAAAGGGDGGGDGTAATGRRRRPWARLLALPRDAAGGWGEVCAVSEAAAAPPDSVLYMYKVAFVDLDIKAASKIPKHAELEQELAACGSVHYDKLKELAEGSGWKVPGTTQEL